MIKGSVPLDPSFRGGRRTSSHSNVRASPAPPCFFSRFFSRSFNGRNLHRKRQETASMQAVSQGRVKALKNHLATTRTAHCNELNEMLLERVGIRGGAPHLPRGVATRSRSFIKASGRVSASDFLIARRLGQHRSTPLAMSASPSRQRSEKQLGDVSSVLQKLKVTEPVRCPPASPRSGLLCVSHHPSIEPIRESTTNTL